MKQIVAYRQAIALKPSYTEAHSNLVFAMHYHEGYDGKAIAEELHRWDQQHAPLINSAQVHPNERSPDRRLRIGYISHDLRMHSVAFFLLPLLGAHDRQQFHVTCYATCTPRQTP